VQPKPVKAPTSNKEMLQADLNNENETIRNYRLRVIQSDKLGEYATAELIRSILVDEQDHQMALATALGIDVPEVGITEP
jgi:bacterioferritin